MMKQIGEVFVIRHGRSNDLHNVYAIMLGGSPKNIKRCWMNLPLRATCVARLHSKHNAMKSNNHSHHQKLN